MAAASVRLASQLFEDLRTIKVLFVGAGEMIELCATHFAAKNPKSIAIANRTFERGEKLAERFGAPQRPHWRPWLVSLGFALFVPVAQGAAIAILPQAFPTPRHTFLAYELLFLLLAVVWRAVVLPRRVAGVSEATRNWIYDLAQFEIVQYALWPLADILILAGTDAGRDAGFALRLVPNTLYYGVFLAFAAWRAPAEAWEN